MDLNKLHYKNKKIKGDMIECRRHPDDEYWDLVQVVSESVMLQFEVVPRYKVSDLSGDEWRVSTKLVLRTPEEILYETRFCSMDDALNYGSNVVWEKAKRFLESKNTELIIARKNRILLKKQFNVFGDAAIGCEWHIRTANEQSKGWNNLSNDDERTLCTQAGCARSPVCLFKLKKFQISTTDSVMIEPDEIWQPKYRWFCEKHTVRGDCGMEDCDSNYEVIIAPPKTDPNDIRESIFGGVFEIK